MVSSSSSSAASGFSTRAYTALLRVAIRHGVLVFLLAAAALAGAVWVGRQLPQEFFPTTPQKEVRIRLVLPPSATIDSTFHTVNRVQQSLESVRPALRHVYVRVGESEDVIAANLEDPDGPNTAELIVGLRDADKPTTEMLRAGLAGFTSIDLIDRLAPVLDRLPDVRVAFEAQQGGIMDLIGGAQAPLSIEIRGPDSEILTALAGQIRDTIRPVPGLTNVRTNITEGAPEALLRLDPTAMAIHGFDTRSLAAAIADRLQGNVASTLKSEAGDIDIRVRIDFEHADIAALESMVFQSPTGARVPLGDLAALDIQLGPREIVRRRQERTAYIMADLDRVRLSEAIERVREVVDERALPRGYFLTLTGEQQQKREAFGNLGFALALSIVLVYMVMASVFESFVQPFLILLTIPLAGIGVVGGLAATGQSINVMAIIGVIMLGGIVVNNAIVLIDRVNRLRAQGLDNREALLLGSAQRLRPVLMTSATTVLGLTPLALGFGEGAELRQAMAIAVIGGLLSSTVLTLVVIPCGQAALDGVLGWLRRMLRPVAARLFGGGRSNGPDGPKRLERTGGPP